MSWSTAEVGKAIETLLSWFRFQFGAQHCLWAFPILLSPASFQITRIHLILCDYRILVKESTISLPYNIF
jgi:hypothetical protein